jgi:transposase
MYLRRINKRACGKNHRYWALVESRRTSQGPRQHVVCYLGDADLREAQAVCREMDRVESYQADFLERDELASRLEILPRKVRTERVRDFGGVWLGLKLYQMLGFDEYFGSRLSSGREWVEWREVLKILVISRFVDPSSELHLAEQTFEDTAFEDLLGVPSRHINDDRLYRALDVVLPHKEGIEVHLKRRLGELFDIEYDLYLYDVTSTYFEGTQCGGSLARHGYSRDQRSDCRQVCIGLVVTREGLPLGYEVFAGNTNDSTTVAGIVETMEQRYGRARCVWVLDRGMIGTESMETLGSEGRKYIIGTPKSTLRKFEHYLVEKDWHEIREGLEVKQCPSPDSEEEVFILCRSRDRALKERAMHERFAHRIQEGIQRMRSTCERRRGKDITRILERRIGRLLEKNSRAAALFDIETEYDRQKQQTIIRCTKRENYAEWATLSEGYYLLRTNITDWAPQQLWEAYIHLTHAEDAFRIHKSDLKIRPIWHYKQERVLAHILISFLSFVLWKTLAQLCKRNGLGTEPRKVLEEIKQVKLVDVILATPRGKEYRIRTIARPEKPTQVLLHKLGIRLPDALTKHKM